MSDLDTLMARLTGSGVTRAYKVGAVPPLPTYPYAVVASSRLAPDARRLDGGGTAPVRFTVQMFGKTADSVADLAVKSLAAFDTYFIGERQIRAEVTTPPYRDPDDNGVLNVTHTYRY